jgi:hypothetical protein
MLEPEDEGPSQESAEIADGLLVGRDSPAGPQPPSTPRRAVRMMRAPAREEPATCARRTHEMWSSIHADKSRQELGRTLDLTQETLETRRERPCFRGKRPKTWHDIAV